MRSPIEESGFYSLSACVKTLSYHPETTYIYVDILHIFISFGKLPNVFKKSFNFNCLVFCVKMPGDAGDHGLAHNSVVCSYQQLYVITGRDRTIVSRVTVVAIHVKRAHNTE